MKPMATPITTNRLHVAVIASGLVLTLASVLIMRQPSEPVRTHLYGDTYVHQEGEWTVYQYDDINAECRFRPIEWEKPVCMGVTK